MESRYINFHGQKGARLTNYQTIYGFRPTRTYLIKTFSILFFYAPELHLRGTRGRCVICAHTQTLPNRTGVCLHGFRDLSAQVGRVYHKAAI